MQALRVGDLLKESQACFTRRVSVPYGLFVATSLLQRRLTLNSKLSEVPTFRKVSKDVFGFNAKLRGPSRREFFRGGSCQVATLNH